MKTNYNQSDVGKQAGWLPPLFKPLLMVLLIFMLGMNSFAGPSGPSMTGSSFCWDGTTTTTIGMDVATINNYHVLYHFRPNGTYVALTVVYSTTSDPFNFLVNYGKNAGEEGLYVTYAYTEIQYLALFFAGYPLAMIPSGVRQGSEVWIYSSPADQTLGFYGTEGTDYTLSGSTAIYCTGSAGVSLNSSELSAYNYLLTLGAPPAITEDKWVVEYKIYDGTTPVDSAYGTGSAIDFTGIDGAPTTYTATATRGTCAAKDLTGSPEVNDQARVKNTTTGLCYLTITEAHADALTLDGHTLICLVDEAYTENLDITKEITLTADPALVHFQLDIDGYVRINADNVTIQDFDGIYSTGSYAIKVYNPYDNFLIDSIGFISGTTYGVKLRIGSNGGTISNSFFSLNPIAIAVDGGNTNNIYISNNIIEGLAPGTGMIGVDNNGVNVYIAGNDFNDIMTAIDNTGDNTFIDDNDFSNISDGGIGILNTAAGVNAAGNNFSFITTTAISSSVAMSADSNWFGHETGPTIASNPCGEGSAIVGTDVVYSPWYFEAAMTTLNGLPTITMTDVPNMSTITKTPLIVSVTVGYPDGLSNYNTAVLTDARIASTVAFPAGSKVISVKYNTTEVLAPAEYALPANDTVYLSEILGGSANPIANHNLLTNNWEITLAGFDTPWTSTLTMDAVTYITDKSGCNNVLKTDDFDVTFDNSVLSITETDIEVCATVDPLKFDVSITYPAITGVNTEIKADAKITSVQTIPQGMEIKWGYNAAATNSYLVPADTYTLLLSDIVGLGAFPLQGHVGTDVWSFEIPSDSAFAGSYDLTIDAVAVLGTTQYVHATDNVGLIIRPLPTAKISSADNITHICEGGAANLQVDFTGTAPWTFIYTDGTTPHTVTTSDNPYLFSEIHTTNKTWSITEVSDIYCSNTSSDTVRIYIGTITTVGQPNPLHPCEGSYVYVPITVKNFEDVGVVSLTLQYDTTALTYYDFTSKYPQFPFTLNGDSAGVIKAGGYGTQAFQIPDNDTLFVIQFTYKGGTTPMTWENQNPASCEYVSFLTGLPFCDVPNSYYYENMDPILAGYLRPKAAISGTSTICSGDDTSFEVALIGTAPWEFTYSDGTSTFTESNILTTPHTITVSPTSLVDTTFTYTPTGVTDANGCTFWSADLTGTATVNVHPVPVLSATATMISCNGAGDGDIDLDPSLTLGPTPWVYAWSNGASTQDVTGLPPGTYTVTVTDNNGCFETLSETITEPDILDATFNRTDVTCFGGSDGTITVSLPTGGYGTYEVSINDVDWFAVTTATPYVFDTLVANTYILKIRDAAHVACIITLSSELKITQPDVLAATVASTNVTCNRAVDATITVTNPLGGHGTFEIMITGGNWLTYTAPSMVFDNLDTGTYVVSIRDAAYNDCTIDLETIDITEPLALYAETTGTDVTCFGADDGQIAFSNLAGGYGTYQFSIDGGTTWQNGGGYIELAPGTYDTWIRDAAHTLCVYEVTSDVVIAEPNVLSASVDSTVITCHDADDATITVTAALGGHGAYEFSIDGTNWYSSGSFTDIAPGTYSVQIRDSAYTSCVVTLESITFVNPDAISVSGVVKYYNPPVYSLLGSVTVTLKQGADSISQVTDGNGAYTFANVCPGTYEIRASRTLGLTQNPVNITDAALVATWASPSGFDTIQEAVFGAGDVLLNNRLQTNDATRIREYFLTSTTKDWCFQNPYPNCRPIWSFYVDESVYVNPPAANFNVKNPSLTVVAASGPVTVNMYGVFTGDFNHSWAGAAKSSNSNLQLDVAKTLLVEQGVEFELPLIATTSLEVGALSMIMDFPSEKLEIVGAYLSNDESLAVDYNLMGNELRLAWNSTFPFYANSGDRLITLKLRLIGSLSNEDRIQLNFTSNPLNELADGSISVIPNVILYADMIGAKPVGVQEISNGALGFTNYPNPFNETTTFIVNLPYSGVATIEVFDMLGKKVQVYLNENLTSGDHKFTVNSDNLKSGLYTATLTLNADGKLLKRTIKIIRNQ